MPPYYPWYLGAKHFPTSIMVQEPFPLLWFRCQILLLMIRWGLGLGGGAKFPKYVLIQYSLVGTKYKELCVVNVQYNAYTLWIDSYNGHMNIVITFWIHDVYFTVFSEHNLSKLVKSYLSAVTEWFPFTNVFFLCLRKQIVCFVLVHSLYWKFEKKTFENNSISAVKKMKTRTFVFSIYR